MNVKRYKFLSIVLILSLCFTFCSCKKEEERILKEEKTAEAANISFVQTKNRRQVAVGGELIGIEMNMRGVSVAGTDGFESENGYCAPGKEAGLSEGDIILSANGEDINTNAALTEIINECGENPLSLYIQRGEKTLTVSAIPKKDSVTGMYKLGLWIRDSVGGVGTLTYYDPTTGTLAALGHGITDSDTKTVRESMTGSIKNAYVSSVTKSNPGSAGQISGILGEFLLGDIRTNCENGIFGFTTAVNGNADLIPVAFNEEIKVGEAKILCTVAGTEKKAYTIEIESINPTAKDGEKEMSIRITDKELLALTGGIVQGMSGSPILQNGYLVGAVTHVFINNPERGYAVFAQTMLKESDALAEEGKAA